MSIEQTNTIDFITVEPETDNLLLTISDHLDWEIDQDEHIWMLQEKVNAYLRFIESGEIYERFPAAKDKKISVRVIGKFPLSERAQNFYSHARDKLLGAGYQFGFEKAEGK